MNLNVTIFISHTCHRLQYDDMPATRRAPLALTTSLSFTRSHFHGHWTWQKLHTASVKQELYILSGTQGFSRSLHCYPRFLQDTEPYDRTMARTSSSIEEQCQ